MVLSTQLSLALAVVGVIMMTSLWQPVASHGRLWTPPGRSSMWRKGFKTPKNFNDNELYCGGFAHQVSQGYKCGICGDPYDKARLHEAGGKYATGTIAATYKQGQQVTLQVQLTASHKGWFEFKICPTNDYKKKATQSCLDGHVVQLSSGGGSKYKITQYGKQMVDVPVTLPADLHCDFCVLQWRYHTGNTWGKSPSGKGCMGCGPQEEFYGCADIKILPRGAAQPVPVPEDPQQPEQLPNGPRQEDNNSQTPETPSRLPTEPETVPEANQNGPTVLNCEGVLPIPGLAGWCNMACNMDFCPVTHCRCQEVKDERATAGLAPGCYATTPFSSVGGLDGWCTAVCKLGYCPKNKCFCV